LQLGTTHFSHISITSDLISESTSQDKADNPAYSHNPEGNEILNGSAASG
jgi:hypothetical protein